jgi:hypothetical protein
MKYAVEMALGAMICIPSFIKIRSAIQKLKGEEIHKQNGDRISLLLFLQNRLKIEKGNKGEGGKKRHRKDGRT